MAFNRQLLQSEINQLQSKYDRDSGALASLQNRLGSVQANAARTNEQIEVGEQVSLLFARTSEYARAQIKGHLEATVTAALQAVFGREMHFEVELKELAGQTAATWSVVDDMEGEEVSGDPESVRGGGVVDICSLALRLAFLELIRPRPEGPVMLDEPCKHLSSQYHDALGEFLKSYCRKCDRQILVVTHIERLAAVADVSYTVTREKGVSEVTRIA